MTHALQTDYLVCGAGAVGLAFADTLLAETDADIVIVDRHGLPGGHWNDAYPFVALHQPSAFYGVASVPLGSGRVDSRGLNAGFLELATGAEVSAYFQQVMQQRLLASGRVRYFPLCELAPGTGGQHQFRSLLNGQVTPVQVRRRWVDGTYYGTSVPSTHTPGFSVAPGTWLATPNQLPQLWQAGRVPAHCVVLGAGKTAMDTAVYLLQSGLPPERIQWVRPRDAWMINRRATQPLRAHFEASVGGQALKMEALAAATDAQDWFARLEAGGHMLRLDPAVQPTLFHYATISEGEVALLQTITQVLRHGPVRALEPQALVFAGGQRVAVPPDTLLVDCTARAVQKRPPVPMFQPDRIVLQMSRVPQPAFSAALCAWLEAHGADDAERNALSTPVPLPDTVDEVPRAEVVNLMNQARWGQHAGLRGWIRQCRLDGFAKLIAGLDPADTASQAVMARLKAASLGVPAAAARWLGRTAPRG
jgi:hypothetical protein